MIGIDTNVLVYAHRRDSEFHEPAAALIKQFAEGPAMWAIPWPCLYEFYSVVTHPRIYRMPSTPDQAIAQLQTWLGSPSVRLVGEPLGHWATLEQVLRSSAVIGPAVHDARVAAICRAQGVTELITLDRDFNRFAGLVTRSLLSGTGDSSSRT